jgi:hypothetical protein
MTGRVALTVLSALMALIVSAEEARQPRIRVEPGSFDFGRVLPEKIVRKEFRLRNLGGATLVIDRISRSCGCTDADADALSLAPGESTSLRVAVETRATPGRVEYQVMVRSNDPDTPALEIPLRATIVAGE